MPGNLYLIPTPIYDNSIELAIPKQITNILQKIDYYIVEIVRTARRYILKLKISKSIDDLHFFVLNKHTKVEELPTFLDPIKQNNNVGLLSEAGIPCVADPGSEIVRIAHRKNIRVIPLVGPSSIFMALMASGLNGQNFAFIGYLPINKRQKIKRIKLLERNSVSEKQTQIFIETPYRNNHMVKDLLDSLSPATLLCIAVDIMAKSEDIKTKTVREWRKKIPDINKRPAIFLIHGIN